MDPNDRPARRSLLAALAFGAALALAGPVAAWAQAPAQPLSPPPVAQEPAAQQPVLQTPADPAAPVAAEPAAPAAEPATTVGTPTVATATLPRDLSPWGMFVHADWVVKAIMIGLVLASLMTWTIWLAKLVEVRSAKRRVLAAVRILSAARTMEEANAQLQDGRDPATRLVRTAIAEVQASPDASADALKERVAWLLARVEAAAGRRIGRGMGVLASVGAISPFVGLFGTVWGIMNSFIGISMANTTNLAVVAPGIAEALLATAIGLFAAIPAVVMYNGFARTIGGYRAQLADAGTLVMRLVSRDCDAGGRMPAALSRAAE